MKKNKLKGLIVDDDVSSRFISEKYFQKLGVSFETAENGIECLEKLKSHTFDFILMDIQMPVQDGMDATRWIRDLKDEYSKNIPIFALTSYSENEHTKEILESGMSAHLKKPFDFDAFVALLKKHFGYELNE